MTSTFATAPTQYAKIGQWNIAYRTFGVGSPILFYNRFRGILDTWDPLFLDALSSHHAVVIFDYPGIGDSSGELSANLEEVSQIGIQLMGILGYQRFYVAGWSYGGLVAQAALFTYPELVKKVVLIGTNPPGENNIPFENLFFERALKPVNDLEDETIVFFEPSSEHSRAAAVKSHQRIAQRLDQTKIPAERELFDKYFAGSAFMKADPKGYRNQYRTIANPVLVISADHDISFAVENWFPLLRNAPSMQHIIINDTGHGLHQQHPELIAGYIKHFLQSITNP